MYMYTGFYNSQKANFRNGGGGFVSYLVHLFVADSSNLVIRWIIGYQSMHVIDH